MYASGLIQHKTKNFVFINGDAIYFMKQYVSSVCSI